MARKIKVDNAFLKRKAQKQNRKQRRKVKNKEPRQYLLIVCEGTKTEPNYFKAFQFDLPRGLVYLEIVGTGEDTLNIVDIAIEKGDRQKEKSRKNSLEQPYDQVWAVFDRDNFPAERFNNAIFKAAQLGVGCAYSNEAFELWYLLHFDLHKTAHNRERYAELLSNYLGSSYQKNDPDIYKILADRGNQDNAIKWAKQIYDSWPKRNPAEENPSTAVFKLVEELNKFKEK